MKPSAPEAHPPGAAPPDGTPASSARPPAPPRLLSVESLGQRYGAISALEGVSFGLDAGEIVALGGADGAGKSTLLRCVAGWTAPDGGDIRMWGERLGRRDRRRRAVATLVPDVPAFWDDLSVAEHLRLVARAHGREDWRARADALLPRLGLGGLDQALPGACSRALQQKLAIAMALMAAPPLLLLDDPLAPLDPVSAAAVWRLLAEAAAAGAGVLLSCHHLPAGAMPARLIVLSAGRVAADGAPADLARRRGLDPADPSAVLFALAAGRAPDEPAPGAHRAANPPPPPDAPAPAWPAEPIAPDGADRVVGSAGGPSPGLRLPPPATELRLFARWWWWQARAAVVSWMRVGGYDPHAAPRTRRPYGAFLLLAAAALAAAAALQLVRFGLAAGRAWLPAATAWPALSVNFPRGILALQTAVVIVATASGTSRMPSADRVHLIGGPLGRPLAVGTIAARRALPWLGGIATLAAAAGAGIGGSGRTALAAAAVSLPLTTLSLAAAWAPAVVRSAARSARAARWLWVVPLVVVPSLAALAPEALLWPGRVALAAAEGSTADGGPAVALTGLALAALAGAIALATRLRPEDHAGRFPPWHAAPAQAGVASPSPSPSPYPYPGPYPSPHPAPSRLPPLLGALAARAARSYARLPMQLPLLLRDLVLVWAACALLASRLPARPWLAWLLAMALLPPVGLADRFAADAGDPFLRQMLPVGTLRLLTADTLGPGLLVAVAAVALWLWAHPAGSEVWTGVLLIPALLALRALCQALTPPPSAPGRWRPPFGPVAAICFGIVLIFGAAWHQAVVALVVACGLILALGWAVAQEP